MKKEISDIPIHLYSRWDLSIKDMTKDCLGCDYYDGDKIRPICYWGVARKELVEPKKPKRCALLKQVSPRAARIQEQKELERTLNENYNTVQRIPDIDPAFGRIEGYFYFLRGKIIKYNKS